jgi:hypothetical protein
MSRPATAKFLSIGNLHVSLWLAVAVGNTPLCVTCDLALAFALCRVGTRLVQSNGGSWGAVVSP